MESMGSSQLVMPTDQSFFDLLKPEQNQRWIHLVEFIKDPWWMQTLESCWNVTIRKCVFYIFKLCSLLIVLE